VRVCQESAWAEATSGAEPLFDLARRHSQLRTAIRVRFALDAGLPRWEPPWGGAWDLGAKHHKQGGATRRRSVLRARPCPQRGRGGGTKYQRKMRSTCQPRVRIAGACERRSERGLHWSRPAQLYLSALRAAAAELRETDLHVSARSEACGAWCSMLRLTYQGNPIVSDGAVEAVQSDTWQLPGVEGERAL